MNQSKTEDPKYVDLNISPEVLTIFYLSHITKIDLLTLTLIFEKIGTSLFYIFYMLSKRKISFPSEANLLKAIKFSDTVELLDNHQINPDKVPEKDKEVFQELCKNIVDRRYIRIKVDSVEDSPLMRIPKISSSTNKSELHSSIKKYIRKEKRRLDKLGKLDTLFDETHPNRTTLIDKIYSLFSDKTPDDSINDLKSLICMLIDGYNN